MGQAISRNDVPPLSHAEATLLGTIDQRLPLCVEQLEALVNINSYSLNNAGIQKVATELRQLFSELDTCSEHISLPAWERMGFDGEITQQPLADALLFRKRPEAPRQILLTGHMDTVFPLDSPFQSARVADDGCLYGPGGADMKGGLLVIREALLALEQHPQAHQLGWTVLLNPDEEIGSPGSEQLLNDEAKKHQLGLIYEPALPDGNFAGARKGSGNFTLRIQGKAAHAGRDPENGRNAIQLAAEIILKLQAINGQRPELTLNTGMIQAGTTTNKVPDLAVLKFNIRIKEAQDANWCLHQLQEIRASFDQREGFRVALHGQFGRMPKQLDASHLALYQLVTDCAQQIGLNLNWQSTGGCCDGNNLSASGLPNIDTLGVRGNYIHSDREFMLINSLAERAQLSALILFRLAQEGLPFYGGTR